MQKWEYITIATYSYSNMNPGQVQEVNGKKPSTKEPLFELLNRLGLEGWEVAAGASDYLLILKRPKS